MEVGRVEHFPVRVVSDDQPHGHEDDAIVCDEEESLDPQFEDDSDFEQGPPENSEPEKGDAGMPWEGRSYEEGPPELEPEVLLELDGQMKLKELDRLLGMTVLKRMQGEHEKEGKVRLQCKYVLANAQGLKIGSPTSSEPSRPRTSRVSMATPRCLERSKT